MTAEKKGKWIYWALTAPFVVTMLMASFTYLAGAAFNVQGVMSLGYPVYILKILGTAKLLGGIAILQERHEFSFYRCGTRSAGLCDGVDKR